MNRVCTPGIVFAFLIIGALESFAEPNPYSPDTAEPGSVEEIARYTTEKKYLPGSVAYIPDSPGVPSPKDVVGRLSGTPDELSRVGEIHDYFQRLSEASPRVQLEKIGTSVEGKDILLAVISAESNLELLMDYTDVTSMLADPRGTGSKAMESLASDGKLFYYILGGLHSPETGSPEMLMELAYRLAVSNRPEIQNIRDNVIVLITPVVEPDGRDRVVEWYYRHLKGKDLTYRELRRFGSPPYWGYYAYHDNNRDGIQLTLPLTRAINNTYWKYHPQVVHDLHESLPLLYISTGHGPYSLAVDPVTVNEWTQFAHHEASELQAMGLPGVWTWGFWDGWWPGYLFSVANNHNSMGRFYETFGNSLAGTFERDLSERKFVGKPVTETQWYRPWPPGKKVTWALRNNTNYMQAAILEALEYAAVHREELLRNFWIKGDRAMQKGSQEPPYAWIFKEDQRDRARLAYLINQLMVHRIEVHRLLEDLTLESGGFPAGSMVVRMDQPYRNTAVNFLEEQEFPVGEPHPPYDDVAWTWPLLYGVEGTRIDDEAVLDALMEPVSDEVKIEGSVKGTGPIYLLADRGQTSLLEARIMLDKFRVDAAEVSFDGPGGESFPAGSWIVRADQDKVEAVARALGLEFQAVSETPEVPSHLLDLPRLGVYQTWVATQDCGWVRYTFDLHGIPYTLLQDEDLRRGGLNRKFDVILFPKTWGNFERIVHGIDPEYGPLPYTKTREYPSHGIPNASDDITGGMGLLGLSNLKEFVLDGGVLVTVSDAGKVAVGGGIVRYVNTSNPGRTPGSVFRARVLKQDHPIVYGYKENPTVFRGNGPVFDVAKQDRDLVVVQFGTKKIDEENENPAPGSKPGKPSIRPALVSESSGAEDPSGGKEKDTRLVLSGYVELNKSKELDGKPAILDVPAGKGRVVMFSFNPMHRYLNHSDFRYLYNIVLNWNDLPGR